MNMSKKKLIQLLQTNKKLKKRLKILMKSYLKQLKLLRHRNSIDYQNGRSIGRHYCKKSIRDCT